MNRIVITSVEMLDEVLKEDWSTFSFDTETTSLKYCEIELEIITMCNGITTLLIDFRNNPELKEYISRLTETFLNGKLIMAQNIPFDLKVLWKYDVKPTCELFDTMVAQHLIDENQEKGLKSIVKRILGYDVVDYETAKNSTKEEFYEYAMNDAQWVWELAHIQKPQLEGNGTMELFRQIEMPFQYVLTEMAVTGIDVDTEKVSVVTKKLHQEKEKAIIEMHNYLGKDYDIQLDLQGNSTLVSDVNFSSSQQLSQILFNDLNLEVIEQTPTGKPSVGKLTLYHYKDHPFIELLQKYKIIDKLLSGFFIPMPEFVESDGKVRPNFKDTGTMTGRLSCTTPNLQQLPKVNKAFPVDTRACFTVPKGYKMITCDYSGQELRVLAQQTQEPVLLDTFRKGKDMHLSTANDFFNLGIAEEDLYENSPKIEDLKDRYKDERNKAKIINFGISYGKGAFGFSKDFGISEDEAQVILDKYFGALPGVKQAIEQCHSDVSKQGYAKTMFGRRRHFQAKEINGNKFYPKSAYRQSFNFLIQGYSADMMRKAMIDVYKLAHNNPHWGLKTIGTVHDEAIYIVKEPYTTLASMEIKNTFEKAVQFDCPIKADIGIGCNYGEAK